MLNANVLDSLTKRRSGDADVDCAAYYIDSSGVESQQEVRGSGSGGGGGGGGSKRGGPASGPPTGAERLGEGVTTRIQYFDDDALRKFLFHGQKHDAAILQRFVVPSGDANHIIRVTWSPQVSGRGRGRGHAGAWLRATPAGRLAGQRWIAFGLTPFLPPPPPPPRCACLSVAPTGAP